MSSFTASFGRPGPEFHPVPWWAWTGRLTKDVMCRQLDDMRRQGIYEFFIFPIYGLEYPLFLQESWFEYIGFTLAECRRRGMKAWIYDELNWPSGTAGGRDQYPIRSHGTCRDGVKQVASSGYGLVLKHIHRRIGERSGRGNRR